MDKRRFRRFKINLGGQVFIYRGLSQKELRVAATKDAIAAESFVLNTCVEGNHNWDEMLAGVPGRLLNEIYKISGLSEEGLPVKEAIEWINSDAGGAEAMALSMVNGLTLETLDNCCPFDYSKYLILGKYLFETLYGRPAEEVFLRNRGAPPENPTGGKGGPPIPTESEELPIGGEVHTDYQKVGDSQQFIGGERDYGVQTKQFSWRRRKRVT